MPLRNFRERLSKLLDATRDAAQQDIPAEQVRNQLPSRTLPPATSSSKGGVTLSDADPQPLGTSDSGTATPVSREDHTHEHGDQAGGTLHPAATSSVAGFQSAADKAKEDLYPAISGLSPGDVLTVLTSATVGFAPPASGGGTVTSVALTAPAELNVGGSPITTSGTLALTWANATANRVFAGPTTGSPGTPAFRALVAADIPDLPASILTSGQLALARGGTNADLSATGGSGQYLKQASSGAAVTVGTIPFSDLASTPTTLSGYGITDAYTKTAADARFAPIAIVGTVTSVALSVPGVLFSVAGSPVTTSGTLALSLLTQTANTVLAGPASGAAATPTMRALVAADLPATAVTPASYGSVSQVGTFTVDAAGRLTAAASTSIALAASQITSGQLALARGGTNADLSATGGANQFLKQSSSGAAITVGALAAGDIPDLSATYQPLDADLTAIAAFSSTGLAARTASNTWAQRTITGTSNRLTVTNGDGVSGNPTLNISTSYAGQTTIVTLGTITSGVWNAVPIGVDVGGTGFVAYTIGDILYASGTTAFSKLSDVATGNVLISGGVATAPSWGKVDLTAHVSGILPSANGGTGVGNSFNLTIPATGTAALIGTAQTFSALNTFSSGISVPRPSGAALFAIDGSAAGSALSIANNATATPFGNSRNFSGVLVMSETAVTGAGALFLVDGGNANTVLISQVGSAYSNASGTASKINVYMVSNAVTIENKNGSTISLNIVPIRTRAQ